MLAPVIFSVPLSRPIWEVRLIPAGTSRPSSDSRPGRKDFRPAPWIRASCSGVRFSATGRSSMRMRVMGTRLSGAGVARPLGTSTAAFSGGREEARTPWNAHGGVSRPPLTYNAKTALELRKGFSNKSIGSSGCTGRLPTSLRLLVSLLPSPASLAAGRGQLFLARSDGANLVPPRRADDTRGEGREGLPGAGSDVIRRALTLREALTGLFG